MQPLSDSALIELWERGAARSPVDRALLLLAAAVPEISVAALPDLSVAERDARVLDLRLSVFGRHLAGIAQCPRCGEALEFHLDGTEIRLSPPATDTHFLATGGLHFRLPTSRDVAAAIADVPGSDCEDTDMVARLLRRCCLDATEETDWNSALLSEAEVGLEALAKETEVQLRFGCQTCGLEWDTPLDICSWFWSEIDRHCRILLDDVHRLAWAYGWDEQRILDMHPVRRAAYLERCSA